MIALDLPGFGESPMPAQPITMPDYARMLDELFVTLGVDSATLVGSSMGASSQRSSRSASAPRWSACASPRLPG